MNLVETLAAAAPRPAAAHVELSADQQEAHDGIRTWLDRATGTQPVITLGGYAGTGKSTVVSVLAHELPSPIAFCAYTGKAASVLGRKLAQAGIATVNRIVRAPLGGGPRPTEPRPYCGTIHGLVYRPCDVCMVEEEFPHGGLRCRVASLTADMVPESTEEVEERCKAAEESGAQKCLGCDPPPPVKRDGPCHRCNNGRYLRRDRLDRSYRIIVVDEASMVDDTMLEVLKSYGIPILAVGDHGQLPPIKGMGSLMKAPDLRLERIHRQAAGNPIIALSQKIREKGDIDDSLEDGDRFSILAARNIDKWIAKRFTPARLAADPRTAEGIMGTMIIAATNRGRCGFNHDVRAALGTASTPPRQGEALICLKNAAPIYNGMRGVLEGDVDGPHGREPALKWRGTVNFVEDAQRAENILMCDSQFLAEKTIDYDAARELGVSVASLGQLFDFGYALTCHKCQGSQAPEVGVVIEPWVKRMSREERMRWLYTAVTRASDRLTVIRG